MPVITAAIIGGVATAGSAAYSANQQSSAARRTGNRMQGLQDDANRQNEMRYQQLLRSADDMRMNRAGSLNAQYTQLFNQNESLNLDAPLERNRQNTDALVGRQRQNMIGRGLYNSTAAVNAEAGAQRQGDLRADDIRNQWTNQSIGLRQRYADALDQILAQSYGARMGVIENRTDAGPNAQTYANLMAQQASPWGTIGQGAGQAIGQIGGAIGDYQRQQRLQMAQFQQNNQARVNSGQLPVGVAAP